MKSIRIAAAASDELAQAVRWYEQRRPLLGAQFFDAVAAVIDLIQDGIEVIAVAHGKRRPGYWRGR